MMLPDGNGFVGDVDIVEVPDFLAPRVEAVWGDKLKVQSESPGQDILDRAEKPVSHQRAMMTRSHEYQNPPTTKMVHTVARWLKHYALNMDAIRAHGLGDTWTS